MGLKKANAFFGYAFFTLGTVRIIYMILVFFTTISNVNRAFNGQEVDFGYYGIISQLIGFLVLAFGVASIIMLILNAKEQPQVMPGYLIFLGAIILELLPVGFLSLFTVFIACGLYLKAGTMIKKQSPEVFGNTYSKKDIKSMDWFYGEKEEKK